METYVCPLMNIPANVKIDRNFLTNNDRGNGAKLFIGIWSSGKKVMKNVPSMISCDANHCFNSPALLMMMTVNMLYY
jgi:hypothetical protein